MSKLVAIDPKPVPIYSESEPTMPSSAFLIPKPIPELPKRITTVPITASIGLVDDQPIAERILELSKPKSRIPESD